MYPSTPSAAASVEAQTIAINGGRPKAWTILYRRLTRQDDWSRQPQLDDVSLQRLIRSFDVTDERRSTTRYVAKVTYVFSQPAVERLLRANNISYVAAQTKRILVIPLSPNFSPGDSWTLAWSDPRFASGFVNAVLPEGADSDALSGLTFDTVSWSCGRPYRHAPACQRRGGGRDCTGKRQRAIEAGWRLASPLQAQRRCSRQKLCIRRRCGVLARSPISGKTNPQLIFGLKVQIHR